MTEQIATVEGALLEIARPELYRMNAFRLTELPVDAQARELSKRQNVIKLVNTTNGSVPNGPVYGRVLPLEEPTDYDTLSTAIEHVVADPERRLIGEFFWFWPHQFGESRTDEALATLARGESSTVYNSWQQHNPDEDGITLHNLAVLSHASALDWEYKAHSRELSGQEQTERDFWWQEAFRCWHLLIEHEAFWSQVTKRIRDLDDPRLTTGMARRLRLYLPQVLLLINAQLAVRAAEHKKIAEVCRQIDLMKGSGFDQHDVDAALRRAVERIRERIKTLCKKIETQAPADPTKADDETKRFLDQSQPLLEVLDSLLPNGDAICDAMYDEVAQHALNSVIVYCNKTKAPNWSVVALLVDRIFPLAVGEILRTRIEENRTTVRNNLAAIEEVLQARLKENRTVTPPAPQARTEENHTSVRNNPTSAMCWYCQTRPAKNSAEIAMFRNVRYIHGGTKWQKITIPVSRCEECKILHSRATDFKFLGGAISFVLGVAIGGLSMGLLGLCTGNGTVFTALFLFGAICAALLACHAPLRGHIRFGMHLSSTIGAIAFLRPKNVRAMTDVQAFPLVQNKLSQGWKIGNSPLKYDNWPVVVPLASQTPIEEISASVQHNPTSAECWYCQNRPAESSVVSEIQAYKKMDSSGKRAKLQKMIFPVHRCIKCKILHSRARIFKFLVGAVSLVLGGVVSLVLGGIVGLFLGGIVGFVLGGIVSLILGGSIGLVVGEILGGIVGLVLSPVCLFYLTRLFFRLGMRLGSSIDTALFLRPKNVRAIRDVKAFPPIENMLSQGWKIRA